MVKPLKTLFGSESHNDGNTAQSQCNPLAWNNLSAFGKLSFLFYPIFVLFLVVACANSHGLPTETLNPEEIESGVVATDELEVNEPSTDNTVAGNGGGVLVYAVATCGIPDPAVRPLIETATHLGGPMTSEIHAGLTRIRNGSNPSVEAELAETYSVDDGGKTYTFTLRNDLKFSDGSPITTTDIKWSWERSLKKSRAGGTGRFAFEPIRGYEKMLKGEKDELEGVQVIDERTLVVHLSNPVAHFPMLLALPVASVVKQQNVEKWDGAWTSYGAPVFQTGKELLPELPVGAGPLRLSHYDALKDECEISRNEHYWGDAASLDGVVFFTQAGNPANPVNHIENLFQQHEIDNIFWGSSHPGDDGTAGKEIEGEKPFNMTVLILNPSKPPFQDVHARRAVAMVSSGLRTDKEEPMRILTEDVGFLSANISGLPFSPTMAQDELQKCDCDDVFVDSPLEYVTDLNEGFAHLVFRDWASHLDISVETIVDGNVADRVWDGSADVVSVVLKTPYPDPSAVLIPIIDAIPGGRNSNLVAEFRELATMAKTETDSSRRLSLWEELEEQMLYRVSSFL